MYDKAQTQGTELDAASKAKPKDAAKAKAEGEAKKTAEEERIAKRVQAYVSCIKVDLQYAIKQLREFACCGRAIEALVRVQSNMEDLERGDFPP